MHDAKLGKKDGRRAQISSMGCKLFMKSTPTHIGIPIAFLFEKNILNRLLKREKYKSNNA
jgi:hypothetical protein